MKNLIMILVLGTLISALWSLPAFAAEYVFQPSPRADLWDLDHNKAYEWGIDLVLPEDEVVVTAWLFFSNIRNHDSGPNDLYLTLIDDSAPGVTEYNDYQYPLDYFAGWGTPLEHYEDLPYWPPQDITYNFTQPELDDLNDFLANDNFGIGFDPDCHFYNCGITLTLETAQVPEPSSYMLVASGLTMIAGAGILRRRRKG